MAKQALGKGLGALIKQPSPGSATAPQEGETVVTVKLGEIVPSPLQPRSTFAEKQLTELMESISQHGIIQPLIVRLVDGKYELIAGERRWRASTQLGLSSAPVIVREASDIEVLEMALIENLQREDLDPIEEARGYVRLAGEFELKQAEIAKRVGKSRATVANSIRLLDLHENLQGQVSKGTITVGHAKAILSVKDTEAQVVIADRVLKKGLNVRATERFCQDYNRKGISGNKDKKGSKKGANDPELNAALATIQQKLRDQLGTDVAIHHTTKKGRIEISYYGNKDLDRLLDLLGLPSDSL